MRRRSDRWVKLAARGRFTFDAKARINNKDYLKISAPVIDRSLMTSPLSVGNCISATLNLSILTDDQINAKSPVVIWGRIFNEKTASEWMEFGTFFIDQRDTSFEGLVTVDCYDAMLKTKQSYLTGTDSPGNWPKTMKAVVEEVYHRFQVCPHHLLRFFCSMVAGSAGHVAGVWHRRAQHVGSLYHYRCRRDVA